MSVLSLTIFVRFYLAKIWLIIIRLILLTRTLRKKCPYSELFWSVFFRIRTEYVEILHNSPYSARMRENTDQNNSEYGHFSRSGSDFNSPQNT